MKNKSKFYIKFSIYLLILISLFSNLLDLGAVNANTSQISEIINPPPVFVRHDETGYASFIGAEEGNPIELPGESDLSIQAEDRAATYLDAYGELFGIRDASQELILVKTDLGTRQHIFRYQQVFQGIPILAGELIVNLDATGGMQSISGEISPNLALGVVPNISPETAQQTALDAISKEQEITSESLEASEPELWIYDEQLLRPSSRPAELVWRMEVSSTSGYPLRELVLINAHRGGVSLHFNQIDTAWAGVVETHTPQAPNYTLTTISPKGTNLNDSNLITQSSRSVIPNLLSATWYVATTGSDSNDCATTSTPCLTINGVLGKVGFTSGDTIKVAEGTYTGSGNEVVLINNDVVLEGGWNSSFSSQEAVSILDGENIRTVVTVDGDFHVSIDHFFIQNGNGGVGGINNAWNDNSLTINYSTISNNNGEYAGGIRSGSSTGSIFINNSTISGNNSQSNGGGIDTRSTLYLFNVTVSNNSAEGVGGGIRTSYTGTATITNSIVAKNSVKNMGPDCYGSVISSGYNILGNTSNCTFSKSTGDITNVDPKLGLLIGSPGYHPLAASSPAINAGNPDGCVGSIGPLDTDQRGTPRSDVCDMGAFEYTSPGTPDIIIVADGSPQQTSPGSELPLFLKALVLDNTGIPIENVSVTFTAPASGASGTFSDTLTNLTTQLTDEYGVATATPFTANNELGSYIISASVGGVASPANFYINNVIWYVSINGNDSNDCNDPLFPCATINGVIDKADFTGGETIYVMEGTYTGAGNEVVLVDKNANLIGGWNSLFTSKIGYSIVNAEGSRKGISINAGITVTIDSFIVEKGYGFKGGGIYNEGNLTLNNSIVRNNESSGSGGGIFNQWEDSTLVINNSEISNNLAEGGGGGISHSGSAFTINNSVINNNSLSGLGGAGGGIFTTGTLYLNNSTVSGNRGGTGSGGKGGGIAGTMVINNGTITNNTATSGGGIDFYLSGSATIQNTIVAGNVALSGQAPDCQGTLNTLGYNIIGNNDHCTFSPSTGDQVNIDPLLGPLIGHPGYHPLSEFSPAIDGGNPAGCSGSEGPLIIDQRGAARVGVCDIGAYEYTTPGSAANILVNGGSPQWASPFREFESLLQAVVADGVGSPVSGETVTFTAPGSGPSGTFSDSSTNITSAISNSFGIATAAAFTANGELGTYIVTGTVSGIGTTAEFILTNGCWFVSTSGDDNNDCVNSNTPCATINGVLNKPDFSPGSEIRVSDGVYTSVETEVVLVNEDVILTGGWDSSFSTQNGISIIDGQGERRGIVVENTISAEIENFVIQNGRSSSGGGVHNLGNLKLINSSIQNNYSLNGGGIRNGGSLIIIGSTIMDNTARNAGGIKNGYSETGPPELLTVINSTISGNDSDGEGGGVSNDSNGIILLNNVTIAHNSAYYVSSSGGIHNESGGSVTISNSIISHNSHNPNPDCTGVITSSGHNFIGDTSGCTFTPVAGDLINSHPDMSPLQDNGGLTLTYGLYPDSPAVDAGNPSTPGSGGESCEPNDQRGILRPMDGEPNGSSLCDIGAYELDPASPPDIPDYGNHNTYTANNNGNLLDLPGTLLCTESQYNCTRGIDPHADAVHIFIGETYNFYSSNHNRNSIDNSGMTIVSTVHFGSGYNNAYWNGVQMVFGDGLDLPFADDVVAHELTHGVTQYTSNLFYYYQSGAISESFSDLWGEFVDLTNRAGMDSDRVRWLIGEDVPQLGGARDMEDPTTYGDPDKMTSSYYDLGDGDFYYNDNGGVHTNSGVNNKAVYLMTDGDSFNGYTVSGIGMEKVGAIYYEVQTHLLTSGADYKDLYYALQQACTNLIGGAEGITAGDCSEVKDALDAVEMNLDPIIGYNPEAQVCSTGEAANIFFDDLESGSDNWIFDAVTGSSAWDRDWGYAASGTYMLWGNDYYTMSDSYTTMSNDVAIPATGITYLHFNHSFGFEDPAYDGGWLEYSVNGGASWTDAVGLFDSGLNYTGNIIDPGPVEGANPNRGHAAFIGDSHGYVSSRYKLSPLSGQNVRFRWRISTDLYNYDWGWFVDDVRVYTCPDEVPPEKTTIISPIGLIDYPAPEYQWDHVTDATRYRMAIRNSSNVIVVWKTFAAADICSGSLCTANPGNFLSNGDYTVLVQATNSFGKSKWAFAHFTVDAVGDFPPGAAMIYYPIGTIADTSPEYEWEHLSNAEQYKLAVKDSSGTILIWKTYNAADICSGAFCKADPGTVLADGDYTLLILPTNSLGNGTWTGEDFTVGSSGAFPPGATVIYSPMGTITDSTPTFQWKHLSTATQYKLAVKDPTKAVIIWKTYNAADICTASLCTVDPGIPLTPNDYSVWVLATNSYGNGIWTYRYFTVE